MGRRLNKPMIRTSVMISPEFYELCMTHNILFVEAMRTGISMLLAEKGVKEYDNRLNLHRKMLRYQEELERALYRLQDLERGKNIKEIKINPAEEEADRILRV